MVKQAVVFLLFIIWSITLVAQVKIHSHNDYTHSIPFYNAIDNQAFSIEADIFLIDGSIVVAHSKKEIKLENTLEKLYLSPITTLSKTESFYNFQLMIDVKDKFNLTYPVLHKALKKFKKGLGRNKHHVNIVISGNRPPDSTFHQFKEVYFDGLPNHVYQTKDLLKIAMISDNFANYSKWNGVGDISAEDKSKLLKVIKDAHDIGKPFRFWNAPDTENAWKELRKLGVDIINTDKVTEATNYFKTQY